MDLSMLEDVERRALREWCSKNKFHPRIVEEALEYQDMITDFWRDRLPE